MRVCDVSRGRPRPPAAPAGAPSASWHATRARRPPAHALRARAPPDATRSTSRSRASNWKRPTRST